jgi:hypothetical protein
MSGTRLFLQEMGFSVGEEMNTLSRDYNVFTVIWHHAGEEKSFTVAGLETHGATVKLFRQHVFNHNPYKDQLRGVVIELAPGDWIEMWEAGPLKADLKADENEGTRK